MESIDSSHVLHVLMDQTQVNVADKLKMRWKVRSVTPTCRKETRRHGNEFPEGWWIHFKYNDTTGWTVMARGFKGHILCFHFSIFKIFLGEHPTGFSECL
jgi:hypothetical protein